MNLAISVQKMLRLNCFQCKVPTQHQVLRSQTETGSTEQIDWYRLELQIVRCNRCQNISFKQSAWNADDRPLHTISDDVPLEARLARRAGVDEWDLPERVRTLYKETLIGFNAMAMTISASGLRAVVEAACVEQGCMDLTLEMKIEGLVTKGAIMKRDADHLHQHRFFGHEPVAGMETPPKEEFEIALQRLEHLLTTLYVLPHLDMKLRRLRSGVVSIH